MSRRGFGRREFLELSALGGVVRFLPGGRIAGLPRSFWDDPTSPRTTPFVAPLPLPAATMPIAPFDSARCRDSLKSLGGGSIPANTRYYQVIEEEALVSLHPELPRTPVWRYRDVNTPPSSGLVPGPTFQVRMGEPQVVRFVNNLPPDHVGFGLNRSTVHNHGAHVEARSDGFPDDIPGLTVVFGPNQFLDYCYALQDVGFRHGAPDPGERPAALWYHDHLLDFTGPNVYRGLAGFFLVYDELDTGNEQSGLRLPSGPYDVPLVFQDRRIARDGTLIYTPSDFNGFLGDKFLVNGAIQPFLRVRRRKYRFRLLDGSNARHYRFFLTDPSGHTQPFDVIATGGGLLSRPLRNQESAPIANAERLEIVIDFARFREGTELLFENRLVQEDGRGPKGTFERPELMTPGTPVLKFIVEGGTVDDPSRVPDVLRPFAPIEQRVLDRAPVYDFSFERRNGGWQINRRFVDLERPITSIPANQPVIWRVQNNGGGWWHPVHVHLEFMRVLKRNGKTPPAPFQDGLGRADTVVLGPNDSAELFFNFRDFPGNWVFHCHNIEHEDHFMMARFDVV